MEPSKFNKRTIYLLDENHYFEGDNNFQKTILSRVAKKDFIYANNKEKLPVDKRRIINIIFKNIKNPSKFHEFHVLLHLTLRNDFIAKNLIEISKLTQGMVIPFVSILGEEHIPGIKNLLENEGMQVFGREEVLKIANL